MSSSLKNYTSGENGLKFPGINALFTPHYGELAIRPFDGVDFYSTSKTWSLGPGQSSMALPVQVRALLEYWSIGVLECWQR
jgi:hypothetical protein